jgi:YHS domain-containing protein
MKTSFLALIILSSALLGAVAFAADSHAAYPLTTCVVSREKLGEMGAPVVINHGGTEVQFCCNGCVKKFNADPAKYLSKLGKKETPQ